MVNFGKCFIAVYFELNSKINICKVVQFIAHGFG